MCGNGILETGEVCDDGNVRGGDACSDACNVASCYVPISHATIQLAVDDGRCATIWVDPGDYPENVVVARDVVIEGLPGGDVTVDGGGAGSTFVVQAGQVALRNLVVTGGAATEGGGIRAASPLTLDACIVTGNEASGDGPLGGGIHSTSDLVLVGTRVVLNRVETTGGDGLPAPAGGGIYIEGGELSVSAESAIDDNIVDGSVLGNDAAGGGIAGVDATGSIDGSSVSGNRATMVQSARGGGVSWHGGSLVVAASVIEANEVLADEAIGGGFAVVQTALELQAGTRVLDNEAAGMNGWAEGGGLLVWESTLTAAAATIEYNTATGSGAWGGGISALGGDDISASVSLVDVSISHNVASSPVGVAGGGGVYFDGGSQRSTVAYLRGCTLADNIAEAGPPTHEEGGGAVNVRASGEGYVRVVAMNSTLTGNSAALGSGGAFQLFALGASTVEAELYNVTVADNVAAVGGVLDAFVDGIPDAISIRSTGSIFSGNGEPTCVLETNGGTLELLSGGYNVDAEGDCGMTGATANDLVAVDPMLELLQDNGGPTLTRAIDPLSPARDAGDPAGCVDDEGAVLDVDQRGEPRPDAITCDIGAFELQR